MLYEKNKITEHQLFSLTVNYTCGAALIIIASSIAGIAKQDGWLSALIAPIYGLAVIWLICFIGSRYPEMTLIEIIQQIFGKWVGSIIAAAYIFFCLSIAPQIPWYIGNFITTQSMSETPAYAINTLFIAVVAAAVLFGIEAITRASEIFMLFVSVLIITSMILVSPNAKTDNLLPVLEGGITPVLTGSLLLSSFLTFPAIILFMVYPFNSLNIKKAKNSFYKGYLWAGFLIFLSILMPIMVLGSAITIKAQYPLYQLAKEINIGNTLSRIEFIIAAVWIVTLFIKAIMYFYAGVLGLAQLLRLKDYKIIVLPSALINLVISGITYPDAAYSALWDVNVWVPFSMTFGLVLPVLLLLVHIIKKYILGIKSKGMKYE